MTQRKVFATCNIGDEALDRLRNLGYSVEVYNRIDAPPKSLIVEKVSKGVDGLITTLRDQIDAEVFEAGEGTLKVVAQDAVGFDNIDRTAANRFGVPFTNTAEVLTHATAEFAFFLLGCVARKLVPSEQMVRSGQWKTWHPFEPFLGDEVTGKTVCVVGTGRIGKAFIMKCSGFDVDIVCCDDIKDENFVSAVQEMLDLKVRLGLTRESKRIRYVPLSEGLEVADFVSLHVPLNEATKHLIGEWALRRMRKEAFLINTSRGPVVDEAALALALREEWIAGAALDVFEKEPLPLDSPLLDPSLSDRLRVFHHFASATRETRLSPDPERGMAGRCVQALIDVLEKNYDGDFTRMPYVVNKEAF